MQAGLKAILEKLSSQPNQKLIDRYLILLSDFEDNDEKIRHTLELAKVLVGKDNKEAMRIAHMVYRYDRESVEALDVIISALRHLKRMGKAEVLQNERNKLAEAIENRQVEAHLASSASMEVDLLVEEESGNRSMPLDSEHEPSMSIDLDVGAGLEGQQRHDATQMSPKGTAVQDRSNRAGKESIPIHMNLFPAEKSGEPAKPTANVSEDAAIEWGLELDLVDEPLNEFEGPERRKPQPATIQPGVQQSDQVIKQAAAPSGNQPVKQPGNPVERSGVRESAEDAVDNLFAAGEQKKASAELKRPRKEERVNATSPGSSEIRDKAERARQLSELLAPQQSQPLTKSDGLPNRSFNVVAEMFDYYYRQGYFAEAAGLLRQTEKQSHKEEWWKNRRGMLQNVDIKTSVRNKPAQGAVTPRLIFGSAMRQSSEESGKLDLTRFWSELQAELNQREKSFDFSNLKKNEARGTSLDAEEFQVLVRYFKSLPEDQRWEFTAAIWSQGADRNCVSFLDFVDSRRASPGFWGLYLDGLLNSGMHHLVLPEVRDGLRINPKLAWAKCCYDRLIHVWSYLGLKPFEWSEDDGVNALITGIQSRRPQTLRSTIASTDL